LITVMCTTRGRRWRHVSGHTWPAGGCASANRLDPRHITGENDESLDLGHTQAPETKKYNNPNVS
jgi:hypothetical protein